MDLTTEEIEQNARIDAARDKDCPACGALPGAPCTEDGASMGDDVHAGRMHAGRED